MPRKTYFISDLHLQASEPKILTIFERFLAELMQDSELDALYILGDLFEAWLGDDDNSRFVQEIKQQFKQLTAQGLPIYFMRGNRDFAIGERFAKETGITILSDPTVIDLYGEPLLLMHGDLLCTDDIEYQAFRHKVYYTNFVKNMLRLPLFIRRLIAKWARHRSRKHTSKTDLTIQDVNQVEVEKTMAQHRVQKLIHGHTHRPAHHQLTVNNKAAERIVLPAWHDQGYVLEIAANWQIRDFTLPAA